MLTTYGMVRHRKAPNSIVAHLENYGYQPILSSFNESQAKTHCPQEYRRLVPWPGLSVEGACSKFVMRFSLD